MILSFGVAPGFLAACEQLRLWQCSEALCFALLVLFAAITGFSQFAGRKAVSLSSSKGGEGEAAAALGVAYAADSSAVRVAEDESGQRLGKHAQMIAIDALDAAARAIEQAGRAALGLRHGRGPAPVQV